jgi:hypothetical protein
MSRASALLSVLTSDPASTSELYERVGYATLVRIGLVPYAAFRAELASLSASGHAESHTGDDGATMWRRATPPGGPAGDEASGPPGSPPGV